MELWGAVSEHLEQTAMLMLARAMCDPIHRWLASWWNGRSSPRTDEFRTMTAGWTDGLERTVDLADSLTELASRAYDWIGAHH